jgi:nucleoside-diphosphate-sugar epimerase
LLANSGKDVDGRDKPGHDEGETMHIFIAGATGVVGRRLIPLLIADGHHVTGTTRSPEKAKALRAAGARAVVIDVYDALRLEEELWAARPQVVIHQLTDLPQVADPAGMPAALAANARLRIEGTRNLMAAAREGGARRVVAQSIAFAYAPGEGARIESDPLDTGATGDRAESVRGVVSLEQQVLGEPKIPGIVLRYGRLYGPGTWSENGPSGPGSLHVDAAAQAARLAVTRGEAGVYNIAEDDGAVSIAKARRELGFDPAFRIDAA